MPVIRLRLEEPGRPPRTTEVRALPASVGRAPSNHVVVDRPFVSARHGELCVAGDQVSYADLGSTNGSWLQRGGESLAIRAGTSRASPIVEGDRIVLGDGAQSLVMFVESISRAPVSSSSIVPPTVVAVRVPASVASMPELGAEANLLRVLSGFAGRAALVRTRDELHRLVATTCFAVFQRATHIMLADEAKPGGSEWAPGRVLARDAHSFEAGPPPSPTAREAMARHEAVLVADTSITSADALPLRVAAVRSMIAVPVFHARVGLLQVESRDEAHAFSEADLDLLMLLAGQYSAVRVRLETEFQLRGRCADLSEANRHLDAARHDPLFVGPDLQTFLETLEPVVSSDVTVLITGETGVGKELVARYLHDRGLRRRGTFWAINCAALSDALLQDELFGHVKGAFTGAEGARKGIFELAHDGTLFLDEIGELNEGLQAKLLRVIETGEVWRLGAERPIRVRPRIVAATNRDLRTEVERGRFRADLYYRLAVFLAPVPALRDRPRDIIPLAEHLLAKLAEKGGAQPLMLGEESAAALVRHSWPGNVRELRNELERVALRVGTSRRRVEVSDLSIQANRRGEPASAGSDVAAMITIPKDGAPLEELERQIYEHTLRIFDGQQTKAARALGLKYTTFRFRAKKVGVL